MKQYVVGFAFNQDLTKVVLIRKLKPESQKDKLNGVGGKIEYGESPYQAMEREFKEETGVEIKGWNHMGTMSGPVVLGRVIDWYVDVFCVHNDIIFDVRTIEEEQVGIFCVREGDSIGDMLHDNYQHHNRLGNLDWLIPMAKDYLSNPTSFKKFSVYYGAE